MTSQFSKHYQHQPSDLNVSLTSAALNPETAKFSWLCRNLRLRSAASITLLPSALPGGGIQLSMAETTSVTATLHSLSDSSPPAMPVSCSASFSHVAAPGDQGGTMEVAQVRFSWAGIHVVDDVSKSVLSAVDKRMLSGYPRQRRPDSSPGGPSSTGSSHAGGSRPPASPTVPRGSPAALPTGPRRNKRSAPSELLPAPSSKSIRSLRSQKLQTRLAQAHEAALAAMMEEDARATVVKPHYSVVEVDPHFLWPDGGVVVFAQFPFLLDDSWRTPGLCLSYCRKVLCDPDPRCMGGTYEAIFTMEKVDVERAGSAVDAGNAAPSSSPSRGTPPAPVATSAPATPTAKQSMGRAGTPGTPAALGNNSIAAAPAGSSAAAGVVASGSTDPVLSISGSAVNDGERLEEEDLDQLPADVTLSASPASVGVSLLASGTSASNAIAAAAPVTPAPVNGAAAGDVESPRGQEPTTITAPDDVPGTGPPAPPATPGAAAAGSVPSGQRVPAAAAAAGAAPLRTLRGVSNTAVAAAAATPPDNTDGVSSAGREPSPSGSAAALPPVGEEDPETPQSARERQRRERESSPGGADALAVPSQPVAKLATAGLHEHYLKALGVSNAELGLALNQTITIKKLAWSPKPRFSMRCAFLSPMDLETTGDGTTTTRSDQFIVATYRARPGQAPVPVSVCD